VLLTGIFDGVETVRVKLIFI